MNLVGSVTKFYTKYKRRIDPHMAFLGAYLTTKFVFRRGIALLSALFQQQVEIQNRYGEGTFALITGGASGIGKEFALDLARKGFNLILVDCNSENLEKTKQEVLFINKEIIVKKIILDFTKGDSTEFYEKFDAEIKEFEISILINNVGIGCIGIFHRLPNKTLLDVFNVNFTAQIMLTHKIIKKMLQRNNKKSLILNVSSLQIFLMHSHWKFQIILIFQPSDHTMKGFFVIEPDTLINDAWKYVGKQKDITPSWKHQLQLYIYDTMPNWFRNYFNKKTREKSAELITRNLESRS